MARLVCPKCGRVEGDPSARFCDVDGERLVPERDPVKAGGRAPGNLWAIVLTVAGLFALGTAAFIVFWDEKGIETGTLSIGQSGRDRPTDPDGLFKRCFGDVPVLPKTVGAGESDALMIGKELSRLGTDLAVNAGAPELTAKDNNDFADAVAREIHKSSPKSPDEAQAQRVEKVAGRIFQQAAGSGPPRWSFEVLASQDANAFMGPGGRGYVFSGLLGSLRSDDELGFILGHEVAHSLLKHLDKPLRAILAGRRAGSDVLGGGDGEQLGDMVGGIVGKLMGVTYSQDQEYEADRLGLCLAYLAGFEPSGAARSMDDLSSAGKEVAPPARGPLRIAYDLLTTHPPSAERRDYLSRLAAKLRPRGRAQ